jgi:hypothetical protein
VPNLEEQTQVKDQRNPSDRPAREHKPASSLSLAICGPSGIFQCGDRSFPAPLQPSEFCAHANKLRSPRPTRHTSL